MGELGLLGLEKAQGTGSPYVHPGGRVQGDGARLSSVVPSARMSGNGHRLTHGAPH